MSTDSHSVLQKITSSLIPDVSIESDFHGFEKSLEYLHCDSCYYKASSRLLMLYHFENSHTVSIVSPSHTALSTLKRNYKRKVGATGKLESVLVCALCGHQSKDSYRMKRHQQLHSQKSAFTCSFCNFSVSTRNRLSCHVNRVHPSEKVQFITAHKLNSKRKALPKQRPKSKVYECGLCDFFTWNSNHMENHNICHQRNRKIKCPLCSFSSDSKCGVSVHLNRHHRRLASTLDDNKNGSSQELLKECEIEPESAPPRRKRPLVTQKSNERASVEDSSGNHAYNEEPKELPTDSSKNQKTNCGQCDFATSDQSHMKRHTICHEASGKFKCDICTYSSNSKTAVTRHSRSFHKFTSNMDVGQAGLHSQSDQEPSVSENEEVNPFPITANIASKATTNAAVKKKKRRLENKKGTAKYLLRFIHPNSLLKRRCLPLIRSLRKTKDSQLDSNKYHCDWLVTNHLVTGRYSSSSEKISLEPMESNIGIEMTACDSRGLSVSYVVESGPHPTSSAIQSALVIENADPRESLSTHKSMETIQTNSKTSGNETIGDVGLTQEPVFPETSQSSFPERMLAHTPIPRCQNVVEYTSIKEEPCSLAQEPPLELEEQQEQVVPPETCFFSTIEGSYLPEEIADVNPLELTNRYTLESEETACRTQLIRYKSAIRSRRLSIRELYSEVEKQRQHDFDKRKELDQLRTNVQAQEETAVLADNTLKDISSKVDQIRIQLHEISSRKLESDFKLKTLETEKTLLRIAVLKPQRTDKELNDLASLKKQIETLKDDNKKLKKEWRTLYKEEAKLSDGLKQALNESKSANKLLSTLSENLKALKMDHREYNEEKLNNLIISTEESVRSYFKIQKWLLEILFLKKNKETNVDLVASLESLRKSIDFDFL